MCYILAKKVIKEVFFVMKKYLLVNLTILFAAAFLWAADAVVDRESDLDIEASGTASWGVDLGIKDGTTGSDGKLKDTETRHGFKNEASWKVKFPLIKKGDRVSKKDDVPVYGEVTLKDIELNIQSENKNEGKFGFDGKVDKLEAALYFYGFSLRVYNKPDFTTNYAQIWKPTDVDDYKEDPYKFAPGFNGQGVRFGYANKALMDLNVGVSFGSNGNWEAEAKPDGVDWSKSFEVKEIDATKEAKNVPDDKVWLNPSNLSQQIVSVPQGSKMSVVEFAKKNGSSGLHSKYAAGIDFSMTPIEKLLSVAFKLNATLVNAKNYEGAGSKYMLSNNILAFGVEVKSQPIDGLTLKFGLDSGAMLLTKNKNSDNKELKALAVDALVSAEYKWVSGGVYIASPGTNVISATDFSGYNTKTNANAKSVHITDFSVFAKFETKAKEDDASHLVKGLDAGAFIGMYRLMSFVNRNTDSDLSKKATIPLLMKVWGAYTLNLSDSSTIKPFADIWVETNHLNKDKDGYVLGLAYDLGVEYVPVEKVTVTAKWSQGVITKNMYVANVTGAVIKNGVLDPQAHKGQLVLSLKVAY